MKSEDIASRPIDRERLLNALLDAKVITPEALPPRDPPGVTTELLAAVHRMLARSRARIMMVQLEDLLGQEEQANLPGTVNEHPNWRRKLALNLEALFENPRAQMIFKVLREERPAPPLARPLSANPG
jgi:4-alpha-glucanotransferase